MRLFFLCNTSLADVRRLSETPRKNDVVIYIRHGQDQFGTETERLKAQEVEVLFLEDFMDQEVTGQADSLGGEFMKSWFKDGGRDFSLLNDISLGVSYSTEIGGLLFPRLLLRIGEALRRGLQRYPMVQEAFSDAQNGCSLYKIHPTFYPLAKIVAHVAQHEGKSVQFLKPVNPFAHLMNQSSRYTLNLVIRRFLGGFRMPWLRAGMARARRRRADPDKPVLYMFIGRDQQPVAERLAESGRFHVMCNELGVPGTDALRCDHLFALPSFKDFRLVRSLLEELDKRVSNGVAELFVLHGVNYGPILYHAVSCILRAQIWAFLFVIAQCRKFLHVTRASVLVINDAGSEPMGNLVSLSRHTDLKIYMVTHGMNQTTYAFFSPGVDQPHVNYLAYGTDHAGFFRHDLKDETKLQSHLVGNPLTVAMNAVRSKRPAKHEKRLLILSFGPTPPRHSARVYAVDMYYSDIFGILGELIDEGWSVTIRSHPYHGHALADRLMAPFGLEGSIQWDNEPTFDGALPKYDVVVSNLTSAYYQSLYAGWPTIFYEPDYRRFGGIEGIETDPMMTGLLTAKDLERPVTNDPQKLVDLIRDTLNPNTLASTFPKKFVKEFAPRFIGPDPENADRVIANYIEGELV